MKQNKKTTNKVSKEHKYRVSVYLGKELYETLSGVAKIMNIPLATATRIMLQTGVLLGNALENKVKEGVSNGSNKSKI